jgi:hypothetical protein
MLIFKDQKWPVQSLLLYKLPSFSSKVYIYCVNHHIRADKKKVKFIEKTRKKNYDLFLVIFLQLGNELAFVLLT